MDQNRIVGSAKQIKVSINEALGKAVGDAKLQVDGKDDRVGGTVQDTAGTIKDPLKSWTDAGHRRVPTTSRCRSASSALAPARNCWQRIWIAGRSNPVVTRFPWSDAQKAPAHGPSDRSRAVCRSANPCYLASLSAQALTTSMSAVVAPGMTADFFANSLRAVRSSLIVP